MGAASVGHESVGAAARGSRGWRATGFDSHLLALRGGTRGGPEQLLFFFLGVGWVTEAKSLGGAAMGAGGTRSGRWGERRGIWVQGSGAEHGGCRVCAILFAVKFGVHELFKKKTWGTCPR